MDDEHSRSVLRMKEIASSVVTKRAKISTTRRGEPAVSVNGVDTETVESGAGLALTLSNKDVDIGGLHKSLFGNEVWEVKTQTGNEDAQGENQGNIMIEPSVTGNGDVRGGGEEGRTLVDEAITACNEEQIGQTEGMMFDNMELEVEDLLGTEDGQNGKQETFNRASEPRNESSKQQVRKSPPPSPVPLSFMWPADGNITLDWVKNMMATLDQASKKVPLSEFRSVMPISVVDELINAASSTLSKEPNCVEVDCHGEASRVVLVGDIHGQFHDLLNLFDLAGLPSENQFYVFNGDYVDRGAWGLEVFLVLLAWKVLMPGRVYLLRGNHETAFCTTVYGFEQEVKTKYGDLGETVYKKCLECFKELPLASIISSCVYTTHGGLFRSMQVGPLRRSKRKRVLELGSLEDLSKVNRFLVDASDEVPSILTDVLWSDPSKEDGLVENEGRGMGLSWGPDCTENFLKQSKLKLIIRSHQGPDARVGQDDFGDMLNGYSLDHVGESGKLYTLFSAPNYPQTSTDGFSSSQTTSPAWITSKVDFEAMGISNPPSWSISLADNAGGTKDVQVSRAPTAAGLPLPSDLPEPHKAAFEYLFELVAALKHMLSTSVIESKSQGSAEKGRGPNENEGQKQNSLVNFKPKENTSA
ncbi:serine/threonine-protein phosphatase 7 isoform X1 [Morus notabilis]|uniref:serine/threonine-protein phosphatase 7 isoform X1 n=1 Tax=Morus notabilis TaxID=981085 RepID=UPI000CED608A|nr:serine/threonine-protein phosphatase 7 isoform X1 [Morus notabilis]